MMKFSLANLGDKENNDARAKIVFPIAGYDYTIKVFPKCKYWRLGLRFSTDYRGLTGISLKNRYNDKQVKHLEICVTLLRLKSY
jgi:hypothetical protein